MKTRRVVFAIALCGAIGASAIPAGAADVRPAPDAQQQWLSIPQVHDKLVAAGYRNIEKIERERGNYEVKATDRDGRRVKLYVNPQTGDVLDRRQRDAKRESYGSRAAQGGQQPGVECNKRRCRDDLPQAAGATPPAGK